MQVVVLVLLNMISMEDTLVQDLIEIKEVEDRPVFEDKGAREYVIEQSMVAAIPEPYIGMEFKSPDDAQQYYNNYARSKGFGTRKNRISRSKINKAMIAREFVCSKEGLRANKYVKREDRVTVAPDEIREGCKAMILVSKKEEGKWIVSRFHTEHNHALASPMSTRFIRSHRTKTKVQKDLMDVLDDSGIRPSKIASILSHESGGLGNLNMTEHDIFNYLSRKRQKQLEKGDAQIMLDYFRGCQSKNPGFFYAIQTDIDGCLANCFWADARSRMAYKHFGDVVTFDPTYLTNKYRMPFVPFAGVNHHFQSILFGCALLWDETEETFIWLLKTWLKAMYGCSPNTIITDQDGAITNAIAKVLPNTTHHFCMWHIEKKFPETLSHVYHRNEDFKKEFNSCIHNTLTPDEFENSWTRVIQKYNLQGNSWLEKIYSIREKWVPAFLHNTFCAGMSTTQRSESLNKYFKDYVNASTLVSKFVLKYEEALDDRYNKEREENFKTMNSKPVMKTLYPMEAEASLIYTRKLFRIFQDELIHAQECVASRVDVNDGLKVYKVHGFNKEKPMYMVTFDASQNAAVCNCHKFESMGILCRHILAIFIKKNVFSLPSQYIIRRWTKDAKKNDNSSIIQNETDDKLSESSTLWFNSVMLHSLGLSEKATRSSKHYDLAIRGIKNLCDELDTLAIDIVNEGKKPASIDGSRMLEDDNVLYSGTTLRDPVHVISKGRPPSLRKKSSVEESSKKSKTCSSCNRKGHTKRTCERHQPNFESKSISTSQIVDVTQD
ncbi:hypothetical protein GQ457_07G032610 [Hibiscus cannabinus]